MFIERQFEPRLGASPLHPVFERQGTSVSLGNLPAQGKADARTTGLGRKEWNEEIGSVRQSRPFIFDRDFEIAVIYVPADIDLSIRFAGGIDGIANQVDEQLFKLIAIAADNQ